MPCAEWPTKRLTKPCGRFKSERKKTSCTIESGRERRPRNSSSPRPSFDDKCSADRRSSSRRTRPDWITPLVNGHFSGRLVRQPETKHTAVEGPAPEVLTHVCRSPTRDRVLRSR